MTNKKYIVLFCILASVFHTELFGQYFNAVNSWKRYRTEFSLMGGVSNYLGDLGGGVGEAKPFLLDMEFSAFRMCGGAQFRYNVSAMSSISTSFFYGKVYGSDQLAGNPNRNNRNITFESRIYELSVQYEYHFIRPSPGHLYHIKGAKGESANPWGIYVFGGIGGFHFNPKGPYNGEWHHLQPLGTEGQGFAGQKKPYMLYALCVPMGAAVHYRLFRTVKMGLDISYRFTSTDYLDDTSTLYYDNDEIRAVRGDLAAYFADPSQGSNADWTTTGAIRGSPRYRDSYFSVMLSLTAILKKKTSGPGPSDKHPFLRK